VGGSPLVSWSLKTPRDPEGPYLLSCFCFMYAAFGSLLSVAGQTCKRERQSAGRVTVIAVL
jgi:hypothetical protein